MQALIKKFQEMGLEQEYVSKEEGYFYDWLLELQDAGYIEEIIIQPSYELFKPLRLDFKKMTNTKKPKETTVSYEVMKGALYTPDFKVVWAEKALGLFVICEGYLLNQNFKETLKSMFFAHRTIHEKLESTIEVKGTFASRQNSTAIKFPLLQKILYGVHSIYAQKAMPLHKTDGIFANTFTPSTYLVTEKTKKIRHHAWGVVSLEEYITSKQEAHEASE